jgi:hypothetical protein
MNQSVLYLDSMEWWVLDELFDPNNKETLTYRRDLNVERTSQN